jgi:hypothetical protein
VAVEYEFNADFDLSLRPGWRGARSSAELRQVEEMAVHVVLIGESDDSLRLPAKLPEEFVDSLAANAVHPPEETLKPEIRDGRCFQPFGWNAAAAELNRRYRQPTPHPPLDTVRTVNSRSFAARIEREFPGRSFQLGAFASQSELDDHLRRKVRGPDGWMLKSQHGNAGLGNRRLRNRTLGPVDRRWLDEILDDDDLVLLEPWVRRITDLCTTFEVDEQGRFGDLTIHEVINTADGAFIGALFDADSEPCARWGDELALTAETVADRLHAEGYFGPVCLDSFVWQDGETQRLRRLVDLNARMHMSRAARRLWQLWGCERVVYWRFFTRRKLHLPESYAELREALGDDAFDPEHTMGVLVNSPLWILDSGRRVVPKKLGVLMVNDSRAGVLAQERRFRERFER